MAEYPSREESIRMTTPLLILLIAAVPIAGLSAWLDHIWRKRHPKQISTSEWLRRMCALEPGVPPVRRYEGAEGISHPVRPKRAVAKLALVKPTRKRSQSTHKQK
jgi:hypothetical protein